ncbi:MAG: SufD family Fe-S cluster assembly protein, partial [Woeseiaceae bacterium]|nr:SufD family Fe-S cluster assembly protein [Woeseiaceae bacterium]
MSGSLAIEDLGQVVGRLPANRLAPLRLEALERLKQRGVPTTRDEDWKYTDLGRIVEISNAWLDGEPAPGARAGSMPDAGALTGVDGVDWIVVADGIVDPASLDAARAAGLEVSLLSETDRPLAWDAPLADLNAALLVDGLHIGVPRNARPARPLGFLLADDAADDVGVVQFRIEIDVEPGGAVELIEYHRSTGAEGHYANTFVRLALRDGASASYVRVQCRGGDHAQTGRLEAALGRDSTFRHAAYDLGAALARNDLAIDIRGAGATAEFSGVYLA